VQAPTLAGTKLDTYFHVCGFFNGSDEQYRVLGPFYKEAIDGGEKLLTIIDPKTRREHGEQLCRCGIDAARAETAGQLVVLGWDEAYLQDGEFDQDRMLVAVDAVIAQGREQGYARSRITGQMSWAFEGIPGSEQLIEYEARVNEVLTRTRQPAVCIYDLSRLTGAMMMDILRCHPLTLVGGVVQVNPFFTPPEELLRELRDRKAQRLA
jgi:hypothetical protein